MLQSKPMWQEAKVEAIQNLNQAADSLMVDLKKRNPLIEAFLNTAEDRHPLAQAIRLPSNLLLGVWSGVEKSFILGSYVLAKGSVELLKLLP